MTDTVDEDEDPTGDAVGVATFEKMVYVSVIILLSDSPLLMAIALSVVDDVIDIAVEYSFELAVGVDPSVV